MSILAEISIGEFLDKLTILRIKSKRILDEARHKNIRKELQKLETVWERLGPEYGDITAEIGELKKVNEALWDIEDRIREKDTRKEFDDEFIELARSVYLHNDRRAKIKRTINIRLGSGLIEEKLYRNYEGT